MTGRLAGQVLSLGFVGHILGSRFPPKVFPKPGFLRVFMARRACIFIIALAIAVCQPSPPCATSPAAKRKANFRAARAAYEADHPGAA